MFSHFTEVTSVSGEKIDLKSSFKVHSALRNLRDNCKDPFLIKTADFILDKLNFLPE